MNKTKVRHRRLVVLSGFSTPQSNELSETTFLLGFAYLLTNNFCVKSEFLTKSSTIEYFLHEYIIA